jgi:hypothetical protein
MPDLHPDAGEAAAFTMARHRSPQLRRLSPAALRVVSEADAHPGRQPGPRYLLPDLPAIGAHPEQQIAPPGEAQGEGLRGLRHELRAEPGRRKDVLQQMPPSEAPRSQQLTAPPPPAIPPPTGGVYYQQVERAKRYRDGSPLDRVKMRIEDEQKLAAFYKMAGAKPEAFKAVADRIAVLVKERDALMAEAA